jgi:hypothetical protein
VKDYLLCRDCEQAFSKNGEDYAIPLLCKDSNNFPLRELLKFAKPMGPAGDGSLVFSGLAAQIDTCKLAYFALSIFWRASVHSWKTINGQVSSSPLRTYEEPIRKFLNAESGFPPQVVIKISVCQDAVSGGIVIPPREWSNEIYTGYDMVVLGLYFELVVGVPRTNRTPSAANTRSHFATEGSSSFPTSGFSAD